MRPDRPDGKSRLARSVRRMTTCGDRPDSSPPAVTVTGFDHVVLRVADVERALEFSRGELGLAGERVDEWRRGDAPFPSVRVDAGTVIDFVADERRSTRAAENMDHFCLVVAPVDLDALRASGRFTVVDGPAPRWGAQGIATSLYVRDPDGNTVELRHY
jgi:catechol 2,3-dioxygenase-like lactoylglutathione lyase family enzyme